MSADGAVLAWAQILLLGLGMVCTSDRASAAPTGTEPEDMTDRFVVPEGMRVTVWARSPLFRNPTNIDIDARGRVWVAEAVNYRNFRLKPEDKAGVLLHPDGDRIVILEDTDGDGAADRSKVFVQDKDLVAPLGVAVIGRQVIVSCSPNLIVYTDDDGDDRPDRKEIFLTGFGGLDHDHGLHSLVGGPDGRWYSNVGNAGPHQVRDRSGWMLRAGSWYTGATPYNNQNTPGLRSDDGRVWVGGVAFRMNPDGTGLRPIGHNFRNAVELCVDSFGNVWQNDNDDTISCRTTWLMEGGNAGYSSADGTRSWQADKRPGQDTQTAHWRQEDPGVIPAGDVYGPGAPTGIAFHEGDSLGKRFRGLLLSCEAGRNVVWGYLPKPDGAGFILERFPFFASVQHDDPEYVWHKLEADQRKWFRPSDVAIGTDGAVYVADWFDQVVGGHQMNDRAGTGTIYRIAPRGQPLAAPAGDLSRISHDLGTLAAERSLKPDAQAKELANSTSLALQASVGCEKELAAIRSPAVNVRFAAFQAIRARGEAALPAVESLLGDANPYVRARVAWLAAQLGPAGVARVRQLLRDTDPKIRITAFRALRQVCPSVRDEAVVLLRDPSPAVRRELALSLRDVPLEQCRDLLIELAAGYDGRDRWYLEALGTGCDGKEEAIYPDLRRRLGGEPERWSAAFAGIVWRLRPAAATAALVQRANSDAIEPEARRQAVDALAFMRHRDAAQAMLGLALDGPNDVRPYAAWWVQHRHGNDWRSYDLTRFLGSTSVVGIAPGRGPAMPAEPAFISPVVRSGTVPIDVDITGAKRLWLVAHDAGNGIGCDWSDWVEPELVGPTGSVKLTESKWEYADIGWGELHVNRNCKGLPMRVGGRPVPFGIGTHANSTIVFQIGGRGFTRFRAQAGIDNGGPTLGGSDYPDTTASVRFLVFHDGPSPREQAAAQARTLRDAAVPEVEKQQVAGEMAQTAAGGAMLLYLAARGQLPDSLKLAVAQHIFRNPDLAVRALASEHFPRPGTAGTALPSVKELAALSGDRTRGRSVFFGERAACSRCHTHAGQGGDAGPDLTQVRLKFDREALLDAILNPSAAILVGYEAWLIATDRGELFSGFIVADADPVVLKDTEGRQRSMARKAIEDRRRLTQSLMPDNVAMGLTSEELADLASFLLSPAETGTPAKNQ